MLFVRFGFEYFVQFLNHLNLARYFIHDWIFVIISYGRAYTGVAALT